MKKVILFVVILFISVIFSHYLSFYLGEIYWNLPPKEINDAWVGSTSSWQYIAVFPVILIFFTTLFSYLFILKSKKSVFWLLSPLIIFETIAGLKKLYVPFILIALALILSTIIRKISKGKLPLFFE